MGGWETRRSVSPWASNFPSMKASNAWMKCIDFVILLEDGVKYANARDKGCTYFRIDGKSEHIETFVVE